MYVRYRYKMRKHIEEHPLPQYFEQQVRKNYNKYYKI